MLCHDHTSLNLLLSFLFELSLGIYILKFALSQKAKLAIEQGHHIACCRGLGWLILNILTSDNSAFPWDINMLKPAYLICKQYQMTFRNCNSFRLTNMRVVCIVQVPVTVTVTVTIVLLYQCQLSNPEHNGVMNNVNPLWPGAPFLLT